MYFAHMMSGSPTVKIAGVCVKRRNSEMVCECRQMGFSTAGGISYKSLPGWRECAHVSVTCTSPRLTEGLRDMWMRGWALIAREGGLNRLFSFLLKHNFIYHVITGRVCECSLSIRQTL